MAKSIAKACLRFTGLFEAELLTELILRYWKHPLAADREYRLAVLEAAADVLRASAAGQRLFDELTPEKVNFVAALSHAESVSLTAPGEMTASEREQREKWLDAVLR